MKTRAAVGVLCWWENKSPPPHYPLLIPSHFSLSHSITPKRFSVSEQIDSQFGSHGKLGVQTVQRNELGTNSWHCKQWPVMPGTVTAPGCHVFLWAKHSIVNVRKSVEHEHRQRLSDVLKNEVQGGKRVTKRVHLLFIQFDEFIFRLSVQVKD